MCCQHCGGLYYEDQDGQLTCFSCGRPGPSKIVRHEAVHPDVLEPVLADLGDSFRVWTLMRTLNRQGIPSGSHAVLRAELERRGYIVSRPGGEDSALMAVKQQRKVTHGQISQSNAGKVATRIGG